MAELALAVVARRASSCLGSLVFSLRAASVRAIAHLIPGPCPGLAPGHGASTGLAGLAGEGLFVPPEAASDLSHAIALSFQTTAWAFHDAEISCCPASESFFVVKEALSQYKMAFSSH